MTHQRQVIQYVFYEREPWQVLKKLWLESRQTAWKSFGAWILEQFEGMRLIMFTCECGKTFVHKAWYEKHLQSTGHKGKGSQPTISNDNKSFAKVEVNISVLGQSLSQADFFKLYDELTEIKNSLKAK